MGTTSDRNFFSEGRGGDWERARFADVKAGGNGTAVLVGLLDGERVRLR